MKAYDKLLDEMEQTNPNDLSIVQQWDIYHYLQEELNQKVKKLCLLAQLKGMKAKEAEALVEKQGMYIRVLRTLRNGQVVKAAPKQCDIRINRINVIVKEDFIYDVVDMG
jgi:hypothetical protein